MENNETVVTPNSETPPVEQNPDNANETLDNQGQEQQEEVLQVSFGDEETPPQEQEQHNQPAPQWVKDMRKENRELKKQLKSYNNDSKPTKVQLGEKPTLESCGYDDAEYESKLTNWFDTKRQVEEQEQEEEKNLQTQQEAWNNKLTNYTSKVQELNANDYTNSEDNIKDSFSDTQQSILLELNDPAKFVYAVGKNDAKLKELSNIKDPVKFAMEVARLEGTIKVNRTTSTRVPPNPEQTVRGSAPVSGVVDTQLKELERKASLTGNRTELIKYKQKMNRR